MTILQILAQYWPLLLQGFETTLILAVTGFIIGAVTGLPLSLVETYAPREMRWLVTSYVELIRGTPMLVQLFLIYYALPQVGVTLNAMTAAIFGLGMNSGAYQAEYFRGAINSVQSGQMEAAESIGLSKAQSILEVILAQALRFVIPAWTNEVVYLIQYSSIVYLITVIELTGVGTIIGTQTYEYVSTYIIIALIYVVTTLAIVKASHVVEYKTAIPGLLTRNQRFQ
ncbi:MAG TPA: amino acid ABC transporter permease [Methylomirabilota bacterium]|nr:amino acid ABC transporter permease [Methylomirabilota bacterium]